MLNCLPRDGSLLATTCKDKKLRLLEPRTGKIIQEGGSHQGTKAAKVAYLGDTGLIFTTGFSKFSDRQYAVWSQADLSQPLRIETIDSSSGQTCKFATQIDFPAWNEIASSFIEAVKGLVHQIILISFFQVSSSRPTTPTLAWCMLLGKGMEMSDIMKSSTRTPGSAILASSYQGRLRKGLEYYQRGGWTCSRARCSGCTSYTLPKTWWSQSVWLFQGNQTHSRKIFIQKQLLLLQHLQVNYLIYPTHYQSTPHLTIHIIYYTLYDKCYTQEVTHNTLWQVLHDITTH